MRHCEWLERGRNVIYRNVIGLFETLFVNSKRDWFAPTVVDWSVRTVIDWSVRTVIDWSVRNVIGLSKRDTNRTGLTET